MSSASGAPATDGQPHPTPGAGRVTSPAVSASVALLAGFAVFASVAVVAAAAPAPPAGDRVSLDELLDRAAWYLDYFVDEFENVVAEESYIQDSSTMLPSFSPIPGGRGGTFP